MTATVDLLNLTTRISIFVASFDRLLRLRRSAGTFAYAGPTIFSQRCRCPNILVCLMFSRSFKKHVRSAVLHIISLAPYVAVYTHGWAADSMNGGVRLKAQNERLLQRLALRDEETRIKDPQVARIAPHRRVHCPPTKRMAILELRAARDGSLEQTARTSQVTAATRSPRGLRGWTKKVLKRGYNCVLLSTGFRTFSGTRSSD